MPTLFSYEVLEKMEKAKEYLSTLSVKNQLSFLIFYSAIKLALLIILCEMPSYAFQLIFGI